MGWLDVVAGFGFVVGAGLNREPQVTLEQTWSPRGQALACLSVRSGFDLLLGCQDWPEGSELVMTAITIPDMVRIVEHHGFAAIPVDVAVDSLESDIEAIERAIGPKTRAIVVAHLFGTRHEIGPIAKLARAHGLLLIEDCAQAFDGLDYRGDERADVSMFSFGTIKTATALGGALLTVRRPALLEAMAKRQADYPLQPRRKYLAKLIRCVAMMALSPAFAYGLLVASLGALGQDYDAVVRNLVRGFSGPSFIDAIRHRPCLALLSMLERRLRSPLTERRLRARAAASRELAEALGTSLQYFGERAQPHTFWLFAVVVENPEPLIQRLREAGFDATSGGSTLVATGSNGLAATLAPAASLAMAQIVYIPVYAQMSARARRRLAQVVNAQAQPLRTVQSEPMHQDNAA